MLQKSLNLHTMLTKKCAILPFTQRYFPIKKVLFTCKNWFPIPNRIAKITESGWGQRFQEQCIDEPGSGYTLI